MGQAERDIAQEIFVPYNCRSFLINALSTPLSDRRAPRLLFHEGLMRRLWPEVLDEERNPPADPTPITAAVNFLWSVRRKAISERVPTYSTPVDRAFQRHPWLTDVERILA